MYLSFLRVVVSLLPYRIERNLALRIFYQLHPQAVSAARDPIHLDSILHAPYLVYLAHTSQD